MAEKIEKSLGKIELQKQYLEKGLVKSGVGELDEMIGGGFQRGTCTLIQEDLGSGAGTIMLKIAENQLQVFNKVLIILSDPTLTFLVERLQERFSTDDLFILDFVNLRTDNFEILSDVREISIKINEYTDLMLEAAKEEEDEDLDLFVMHLSLTPFLINLIPRDVTEMLYENLNRAKKFNLVNIVAMQKQVVSNEFHAKITSMFHGVIDLVSDYKGIHKINYIRILKFLNRYYDLKMEPYVIKFDRDTKTYHFLIKSAFLTTFDTYIDLLSWQSGQIFLSQEPYMLIPIDSFGHILDIPMSINEKVGKSELNEKGKYVGRKMTAFTEQMYLLKGTDLLKATVRGASLQGFGYIRNTEISLSENLLTFHHRIHPTFNIEPFLAFMEGFFAGMIKQCFDKEIRSIKFAKDEGSQDEYDPLITQSGLNYLVTIRLESKTEAEPEVFFDHPF